MGMRFRRIFEISLKMPGAEGRTPRMTSGPRFYTAKPESWDASPNGNRSVPWGRGRPAR